MLLSEELFHWGRLIQRAESGVVGRNSSQHCSWIVLVAADVEFEESEAQVSPVFDTKTEAMIFGSSDRISEFFKVTGSRWEPI